MRAEKQSIAGEYAGRLQASPFFLVVDYTGLKVAPMTELRKRLALARAEIHVVKNSIFRLAAKEAGLDLGPALFGQMAVVTGLKDVAAAAKVLKNFHAEFDRPKIRFGFLNNQRLEAAEIMAMADLPPLNELRARLIGLLNTPATRLAQVVQAPARQIAQVIRARSEKA